MQLVSKISYLYDPDPPTSQTDVTDGRTTCDHKTALCTIMHRAVKIGKQKNGGNIKWLIGEKCLFKISNRLQQFCASMPVSGDVTTSSTIPDYTWPDVYRRCPNSVY